MRYRLIAIDLDGTLLCDRGAVSDANRAAIAAAMDAGVTVVPCTGRGWRESQSVLKQLPAMSSAPDAVGVFNTGAIVSDLATGQARSRAVFAPDVAGELIALLAPEPEAVLAFTDPDETGMEYLVTGQGEMTPNTKWWFELNGLRHKTQPTPDRTLLEHMGRIGMVLPSDRAPVVLDRVKRQMGDRANCHAFPAVQLPEEMGQATPMHIVEVFAPHASKWQGIRAVADSLDIADGEVAVLGDQINDLPMFERAGCAIAMDNAIPVIRDSAHHITRCNNTHGVAHAIEQLLAGVWGLQPRP